MPWQRRVQYFSTFAVSLASLTLAISSAWITPVMPKLKNNETDIVISPDEIALMVAMSQPGFVAGSLATWLMCDRIGRRNTLLLSAAPIALGTIMVILGTKAWYLYVTKFFWGIGTGMVGTVVPIYIAEIADKDIRGSLFLYTRVMFNFGGLLMLCIGSYISYATLNYMLLALPLCYAVACWFIPESPYYYLKDERVDEARKAMWKLKGSKDGLAIEAELSAMQENVEKEMRQSSNKWDLITLFTGRQYRRAIVITAGLKLTQIMTGAMTIQQYLGVIIEGKKANMSQGTVFIIFGVVRFVVGIMSSALVDRVGRRPLLIYSYIGTGVSLAIVGIYFFLHEVMHLSMDVLSVVIPFGGIILSNVISTLGYQSVIFIIPAELFPINVKTVAMTANSIFGGIVGFSIAIIYQKIINASGLYGAFSFFVLIAFAGAVFVYYLVPETKGKSLKEIQIVLQGDSTDKGEHDVESIALNTIDTLDNTEDESNKIS